jgi:hypothetical protein
MRDIFTVEETNLLHIYDNDNREVVLSGLVSDLHEIDDLEMIAVYVNTIEKLESISDEVFNGIDIYNADDFENEEV